jgi:hypothetical protein
MLFLGGVSCLHAGEMNLNKRLAPVPPEAKFEDPNYFIWCGSMVRDEEGKCHLLYSRWPRKLGFYAWVTHSEVAYAVADQPTGPYKHVNVVLPPRGAERWDGLSTHNPTIHQFDGKYYLYYSGNTGDGKLTKGLNWTHRNSQRIGVAVADHTKGPWKRFDQPLIDVGKGDDALDALMVNNPSICRRPDGTYLMVYKCSGKKEALPFGGPMVHMVATSDSPTGPFTKHPDPIFTAANVSFPAEDPYIWAQDGKFWAIVKDMNGSFTKAKRSLVLFESCNGFQWELAKNALVTTPQVNWKEGGLVRLEYLERPQLWLKDGVPAVLFCAAKKGNRTFNVHIPLKAPDE